MKLEQDIFPDFYQSRECIMEEQEPGLFTGRKQQLEYFWYNLYRQANRQHPWNLALTAQRKSGKSAFLARCFNLAFWEQEEIIPFYYSLQEEQYRHLKPLCYDILFEFAKQAVAFALQDPAIVKINRPELFRELLKNRPEPWKVDILDSWEYAYPKKIEAAIGPDRLNHVWLFINEMSNLFHKSCVFIFDEAQELARCVLHEAAEAKYPSLEGIDPQLLQKYILPSHESLKFIHNNARIWILLSGSCVSMLMYRVISHGLENRFQKTPMEPLGQDEAMELVRKIVTSKKVNGHDRIAEQVYELVGGNPFYITTLFEQDLWQARKTFDSPAAVEAAYRREVLEQRGKIFRFWNEHLRKNAEVLNHETPEEQRKTYQLLRYIASVRGEELPYWKLETAFPEMDNLMPKLLKLQEADLLLTDVDLRRESGEVYGLRDNVLAVAVTNIYYRQLFNDPHSKHKEEELRKAMRGEILEVVKTVVKPLRRKVKKVVNTVKPLRSKVKTIEHRVENLDDRETDTGKQLTHMRAEVKQTRQRASRAVKTVAAQVNKLESDVAALTRNVRAERGTAALVKGIKRQNQVKKLLCQAAQAGQGFFAGYELLERHLSSLRIADPHGKGCEIDLAGKIVETATGKSALLVVEVKDQKAKVSLAQAQKLLQALKTAQRDFKLPVVGLYLTTSGEFTKTAIALLDRNRVKYGKIAAFVG